MKVQTEIVINSRKEAIWEVVSSIEKSVEFISAINKIDVLESPPNSLVGFKWKETRTMFGREAVETMTITHAEPNKFYQTYAASHGAEYISRFSIEESQDSCILRMEFEGKPQTFKGKLVDLFFGKMMLKSTEKALYQDLLDIKRYVENHSQTSV